MINKIKYLIAFLLTIMFAKEATSQQAVVHLFGGAGYVYTNNKTFVAFKKVYAAAFDSIKAQDWHTTTAPYYFNIGFSMGITHFIGLSIEYYQTFHKETFSLNMPEGKEFRHIETSYTTPFNFALWIASKKNDNLVNIRFGLVNAALRTYFEYPDGTISYGKEKILNGVYTANGLFAGIDYNIKLYQYKTHAMFLVAGINGYSTLGPFGLEDRSVNLFTGSSTKEFARLEATQIFVGLQYKLIKSYDLRKSY
ncbi:MAG: hypothetical protein NTX03_11575 [Bacteroidetes bacterium]|nr:hypothetical protein [Bacteroidota bacterium]